MSGLALGCGPAEVRGLVALAVEGGVAATDAAADGTMLGLGLAVTADRVVGLAVGADPPVHAARTTARTNPDLI
jgi:hypothetical protein